MVACSSHAWRPAPPSEAIAVGNDVFARVEPDETISVTAIVGYDDINTRAFALRSDIRWYVDHYHDEVW